MYQKSYYRIRELADTTGVSTDTIRRWIKTGQLESRKVGGTVLIPIEAVLRLGLEVKP